MYNIPLCSGDSHGRSRTRNPRVIILLHFNVLLTHRNASCHGIAAVNPQIRSSDVLRGVGQEEGDGPHEILGDAHLALRDERRPFGLEVGVVVEDLLRAA
jgi:hypothetical protein